VVTQIYRVDESGSIKLVRLRGLAYGAFATGAVSICFRVTILSMVQRLAALQGNDEPFRE